MYDEIIDPKTGNKFSLSTQQGKYILLNYLKVLFRDATQIGGSHASKGPEIVVDGIEIYWEI